ncbi:MAG: pentapeptide repeat-containing protein [Anaerolineae bacterium]|nr:pentapeptide repeat-containing protein [Anaerolineae bacterium]
MSTNEVMHFVDSEGKFLTGQALADAIKMHSMLRFNSAREYRIDWRPDLSNADLSVKQSTSQVSGGMQNKILRDPGEWKPPDAASLWKGDARYANFSGSDLGGANLNSLNLTSANFSGANLKDADLSGAQVRRGDFKEANCEDTRLNGADLFEADLTRANLRGADLRGANLYDTVVDAAALSRSLLDPTTILPDGEHYGNPESEWTNSINEAREIPTEDLIAAMETVAEEVAAGSPAGAGPAGEPAAAKKEAPSFFARLWAGIKRLFGR